MHCSLCTRDTHALTCPTCANTILWPKRYDCILVNTDKEKLQNVVDNYKAGPRQQLAESILEAKEQHKNLERIEEKHRALQEEVKQGKARIAALKAQNGSRRAHLEERNHGLEGRRGNAKDVVQKETTRVRQKWAILSSRTAEARNYLCQEAALLYGLRRVKSRSGRVEILLGGLAAPTLAELNTLHNSQVTTVLGYLSHLLVLIAHYLSIKLPNEITLPSRSSPVTTIRNRTTSKPRPLHIPSPLSTLARENHTHYTFFLDAYAMLCHNVSFVCYTQGLVITDIEEVCRPVECLYRLLILREASIPEDSSAKSVKFGDFSHGTANGYLGKHEGQNLLKRWTISLTDCQDKVRNTVTGDGVGLEWDIVDVAESGIETGPLAETAFGADGGWMKIRGGRKR